jgi:hypothetical protein
MVMMVVLLVYPLWASLRFLRTPVLRSQEFESSSVPLGSKISCKASEARQIIYSYRFDSLVLLTLALHADQSKNDTLRESSSIRTVF